MVQCRQRRSRPGTGPATLSLAVGMAAGALLAVAARLTSVLPPALRSRLTVEPLPDPGFEAGWDAVLVPSALQARDLDRLVTLVGAGVALVLMVAAVNLVVAAGARAVSRRREMAVRHALGPTRWALLAPLVVEGTLLALLGAALAAGLIGAALPWLARAPFSLAAGAGPGPALAGAALVGPVLLTVALATLPALDVWTLPSWSRLVSGDRTTTGPGTNTFSRLLLAGQVALAVGILFGSTLLLRSARADPADGPGDVALVPVSLDGTPAMVARALDAVRGQPGVASAGLGSLGAVRGVGPLDRVITECKCSIGGMPVATWAETPVHHAVTAGFFDTLGLAVEGAAFADAANRGAVVVNRSFVDGGSLGSEPLTRSIQPERFGEWRPVAGIVDDHHHVGVGAGPGPRPALYVSALDHAPREAVLVFRGAAEPLAVRDALREAVPGARFGEPVRLAALLRTFAAPVRWLGGVLAVLGALAAALAGYGAFTMARTLVEQRRSEIGVRLALGGRPVRVAAGVLAGVLKRILAGAAFGLVATASVAHGLDVLDPTALATVSAALIALAGAGAVPVLAGVVRADPARLLRSL